MPSSSSPAIFSDDVTRTSTPPSSPPGFPWEAKSSTINVVKTSPRRQTTAFSLLGKRKALEPLSDNVRPTKRRQSSLGVRENKTLTQMQISLGQKVQKKCKQCGMEYVPSSVEDRKLHDVYHKQNMEGYDVGRDFVQKARGGTCSAGAKSGDSICALDWRDTVGRKKRGQAMLEIVQRELGAAEIAEEAIWSAKRKSKGGSRDDEEPTYTAYLYIRETKCLGFLLVQRISAAYEILETALPSTEPPEPDIRGLSAASALATLKARQAAAAARLQAQRDQPIQLSSKTFPARLGVSRIWTSPKHRHQNIATALLDAALEHHIARRRASEQSKTQTTTNEMISSDGTGSSANVVDRGKIEKDAVAFSQPTEAGIRLARRWFGRSSGWKVYMD